MLMLTLLYILFGVNLFQVLIQHGLQFYKCPRFWMTAVPIGVLTWIVFILPVMLTD